MRVVRSAVDTLTGFPVSKAILVPRTVPAYEPAPYTAPYPFGPATAEVDVSQFLMLPRWLETPRRLWRTSRPLERAVVAAVVLFGLVVGSAVGFASLTQGPSVPESVAAAVPEEVPIRVAAPARLAGALESPVVASIDLLPERSEANAELPIEAPATSPRRPRLSRRALRRRRARRARRLARRRAANRVGQRPIPLRRR